jgi:hypothetical protein
MRWMRLKSSTSVSPGLLRSRSQAIALSSCRDQARRVVEQVGRDHRVGRPAVVSTEAVERKQDPRRVDGERGGQGVRLAVDAQIKGDVGVRVRLPEAIEQPYAHTPGAGVITPLVGEPQRPLGIERQADVPAGFFRGQQVEHPEPGGDQLALRIFIRRQQYA